MTGAAVLRLFRKRSRWNPDISSGANPMTAHKFKTGQTVTMATRPYGDTPMGSFSIVRALPTEHGIKQYRIKSSRDGHERVVSEAELS
jgi:hypothetical protein